MNFSINAIPLPEAPDTNAQPIGEKAEVPFSQVMQAQEEGHKGTTQDGTAEEQSASPLQHAPEEAVKSATDGTAETEHDPEGLQSASSMIQLAAISLLTEMAAGSQVDLSVANGESGPTTQQQLDTSLRVMVQGQEEGGRSSLLGLGHSNSPVNGALADQTPHEDGLVDEVTRGKIAKANEGVEKVVPGEPARANESVDRAVPGEPARAGTGVNGTVRGQILDIGSNVDAARTGQSSGAEEPIDAKPQGQTPNENLRLVRNPLSGTVSLDKTPHLKPEGEITLEMENAGESIKRTSKASERKGFSEANSDSQKEPNAFSHRNEGRVLQASAPEEAGNPFLRSMGKEMGLRSASQTANAISANGELGGDSQQSVTPFQQPSARAAQATTNMGLTESPQRVYDPSHLNYSTRHSMANAPFHMLSLKVTPPHLGPLRMKVQVRGEEVRALFLTEAANQKIILDRGLPLLRLGLQDQGFSVQELQVQMGTHSGGETSQHPLQNGRGMFQSEPNSDAADRTSEEVEQRNHRPLHVSEGQILDVVI